MRALTFRIFAVAMLFALPARAFDTNARAAWVYDVATGTVLMEKNADEPLPPASMSKLMTVYMLFEALKEGRLQMDTRLPVSTKALVVLAASRLGTPRLIDNLEIDLP